MVWDTYYRKNLVHDTQFMKTLGFCQDNRLWPHNLSEITNTTITSKIKIGTSLYDNVTKNGRGQGNYPN